MAENQMRCSFCDIDIYRLDSVELQLSPVREITRSGFIPERLPFRFRSTPQDEVRYLVNHSDVSRDHIYSLIPPGAGERFDRGINSLLDGGSGGIYEREEPCLEYIWADRLAAMPSDTQRVCLSCAEDFAEHVTPFGLDQTIGARIETAKSRLVDIGSVLKTGRLPKDEDISAQVAKDWFFFPMFDEIVSLDRSSREVVLDRLWPNQIFRNRYRRQIRAIHGSPWSMLLFGLAAIVVALFVLAVSLELLRDDGIVLGLVLIAVSIGGAVFGGALIVNFRIDLRLLKDLSRRG